VVEREIMPLRVKAALSIFKGLTIRQGEDRDSMSSPIYFYIQLSSYFYLVVKK
jgi:hypothetical protein